MENYDLLDEDNKSDDDECDDDNSECAFCSECDSYITESNDSDDNLILSSPHQNEPDMLSLSLQEVINQKKLTPDCFMYKFLTNVFDYALQNQYAKNTFSWNTEVLEFFNSVQHLGGERTVNFLRGPVHEGQGRGGSKTFSFNNANLGGPSYNSRSKLKSGYTNKSGVHKNLVDTFQTLSHFKLKPHFQTANVNVIAVAVASDGTALKPSIQFDPLYKTNIGLTDEIDIDYVKDHPDVRGVDLKDRFVSEAVVTFCTDVSNSISMPVAVDYMAKKGKTGGNILKLMLERIRLLQICRKCLAEMPTDRCVLDISDIKCISKCEDCISLATTCENCIRLGHTSHIPSLRACTKCINDDTVCQKLAVNVLTLDCEEGNKQAMEEIMLMKENQTIDAEFMLLVPMPDVIHVGKSIKCSFSNWFLMLSGYRSALPIIRSLRKNSDPIVKDALQRMLKAEDVRNRDRMAVDPIIRITKPEVCSILSSLDKVVCTIIPERMRYEETNKPGMFCPVSICMGPYGFIVFLDYNSKTNRGRVVLARLHYPVTCKIICNDIPDPRNLAIIKTIVYVPEYTTGKIRVIPTITDKKLKVTTLRKNELQCELRKRNENTEGNVKVLQSRLGNLLEEKLKEYNEGRMQLDYVNLTDESIKIANPAAVVSFEDLLFIADDGTRKLCQLEVESDGIGFVGRNSAVLSYDVAWATVLDITFHNSKLYISTNTGIYSVSLDTKLTLMVLKNDEHCQITGISMYCNNLIFSDVKSGKLKLMDDNGLVVDVAGSGAGYDRDGSGNFATLAMPHGIACEENTIYVCDTSAQAVKMITDLKETGKFLSTLGEFYSAFGIHLKGTKPKTVSLTEAKVATQKIQEFLEDTSSFIKRTFYGKEHALNGPEGMVSSKTVKSIQLIVKSLEYLEKDLSGVSGINLQSFLTGQVEHFHATSHIKFDTPTMSQHARDFHDIIKESIKKITQWSVHYFTHRDHYYPVPETAIPLSDVPSLQKPKPTTMKESDRQLMIRWAERHGKCVRQRTVRGDNTKDRAGTLPESAYEPPDRENQKEFSFPPLTPSVVEKEENLNDDSYDTDSDENETDDDSDSEHEHLETADNYQTTRTCTRSGRNIVPRILLDL